MKNKEKIFTYLIALILIFCIGTKLISCNSNSSKSKMKETIEKIEKENDELEYISKKELDKIAQTTVFVISNQKELSLTQEQINKINNAGNEILNTMLENIQQVINDSFSNKNYDSSKAKKKIMQQIDSYYATLKNILPEEIYNKCISYSAEELKKLNSQNYIQQIKEFQKAFIEAEKSYEKNKELLKKHNIDIE